LGSNVHLFNFSLKIFFLSFGICRGGRLLIADEMGLGKTVQALAIASAFRFLSYLIGFRLHFKLGKFLGSGPFLVLTQMNIFEKIFYFKG